MAKKKSYHQRNQESIQKYGKSLYQRRIESARARGLSTSQGRGHARRGENPANFIDNMMKTLGDFFGGEQKRTPEEIPYEPSPTPIEQVGPPQQYESIFTTEQTVQREGDNVFYVSPTYRESGKMYTLGRWQAGTAEQAVSREDIEDLLDIVPPNQPRYVLIIWGSTESIYPGKISTNTYLSIAVEGEEMFDSFEDNPLGDVTDWINAIEDLSEGPRWTDTYSVSIVDRF